MQNSVNIMQIIIPVRHLSNTCSLSARLSQDLAKDLATLAREIHDVAGDGEPQNPEGESSAPVIAHEQVHEAHSLGCCGFTERITSMTSAD